MKLKIMKKKKYRILFAALLTAVCLTGCGTAFTAPIAENDLAAVVSVTDDSEITANTAPGIYITGEEPDSIIFSWEGDTVLRWTNDCSTPTGKSKSAEDGTVSLTYKDTGDGASYQAIIRCALFREDTCVSDVYTFVYTHAEADRFTMPVVSIVSDNENFYDDEKGILVPGKLARGENPLGWQAWYHAANYYMRGIEWERPIALSVFDEMGNLRLNQNCGVRVSGGYTRVNIQKSLRIYARKDYSPDTGVFPYSFWGALRGSATGTPVSYSDTVLFRGGSNNEGSAIFTTPCLLLLLDGTYLDAPAVQTVVQYINGGYRGIVTQLEDFDEDYFEQHYGVAKENLTTMKGSVGEVFEKAGWRVDDGPAEEKSLFLDMIKFIARSDMRDPDNYVKACEMLDMRNVIEYFSFELYLNNTDWPQNNMRVWRYNGNNTENGYNTDAEGVFDGRWRFLTKDLDLSFGFHDGSRNANPYRAVESNCSLMMKNMFHSLLANPEFADLTYSYMFTLADEVVSPQRCAEIFDLMQIYTGREIAYCTSVLGVSGSSRGNWNTGFNIMRQYAESRGKMIQRFTKNETDRIYTDITVQIEGNGTVQLGWYDIESGSTRRYLCDTRIPLDAPDAAVTIEGGHIDADGWLIADKKTCTVTVVFPSDNDMTVESAQNSIVINEVKFRDTEIDWIELYNPTNKAITLKGWSVGKHPDPKLAQKFDAVILDPNGRTLICCTDYENSARIEGLHVPMTLRNGDTLYLFNKNGETVDEVPLETCSKTVHLGRFPDAGEWIQMSPDEATPGKENIMLEYKGSFTSEKFSPYLLAWGRAYAWGDYFFENDGITYVKRDVMLKLCEARAPKSTLTTWIRKHKEPFTLDALLQASKDMQDASVRYAEELKSVIIR